MFTFFIIEVPIGVVLSHLVLISAIFQFSLWITCNWEDIVFVYIFVSLRYIICFWMEYSEANFVPAFIQLLRVPKGERRKRITN